MLYHIISSASSHCWHPLPRDSSLQGALASGRGEREARRGERKGWTKDCTPKNDTLEVIMNFQWHFPSDSGRGSERGEISGAGRAESSEEHRQVAHMAVGVSSR